MLTKTYLPSNLCDSSDGSDISDNCDSMTVVTIVTVSTVETKKLFEPTNLFLPNYIFSHKKILIFQQFFFFFTKTFLPKNSKKQTDDI